MMSRPFCCLQSWNTSLGRTKMAPQLTLLESYSDMIFLTTQWVIGIAMQIVYAYTDEFLRVSLQMMSDVYWHVSSLVVTGIALILIKVVCDEVNSDDRLAWLAVSKHTANSCHQQLTSNCLADERSMYNAQTKTLKSLSFILKIFL